MSEITQTALKRCVLHTLRDAFSRWLRVVRVCARARVCIQIVLTTARGISTLRRVLRPNRRVEHGLGLEKTPWQHQHHGLGSVQCTAPAAADASGERGRTLTVLQQCDVRNFQSFFSFFKCLFFFLRFSLLRHASLQNKSSSCCSVKISFYVGK